MQQSDVYYQLLSQHVSGIIMPIFRITINFLSNHPLENKMAAYRYLTHRMYTPPLGKEQEDRE